MKGFVIFGRILTVREAVLRAFSVAVLLLIIPSIAWSAARSESSVVNRGPDRVPVAATQPASFYSDVYSNVMTIVRALLTARPTPNTGRVSPRGNTLTSLGKTETSTTFSASEQDWVIQTKQQYINYLKNSSSSKSNDCSDKYTKYNNFFFHDSSLSGKIAAKNNSPVTGRLDTMCEFLDYAHWCFAMGYAYDVRDFENNDRTMRGYKCFTYQEFCESKNRVLDNSKVDGYLSKIIDEIMFYNKNIRNTDKNTVQITTEKKVGAAWTTSSSWKGYDTDSWVRERISSQEMTRLLCQ